MSARRNPVEELPPISPVGLSAVAPTVMAYMLGDGRARLDILPHAIVSKSGWTRDVPYIGDVYSMWRDADVLVPQSIYVVFRFPPIATGEKRRVYWHAMRRDRFERAFKAGEIEVGTYVAAEIIIPGTVGQTRSAGHESVSEQWRTPDIKYA